MSAANNQRTHLRAILLALLVVLIWSSSWVFVKIGLDDVGPLTFAGLRYGLAALCLLPLALRPDPRRQLRKLRTTGWLRLVILGLLFYAVTQGAIFIGLESLPAATVSLLLSCTTLFVTLVSIPLLSERPSALQWAGVVLNLVGVALYFYPVSIPQQQVVGLVAVGIGVVTNALSAILGRHVNRSQEVSAVAVTVVSMGVGSLVLLVSGLAVEGLPQLAPVTWAIIAMLAVVNTALAFTLWNHTLRTLSASESSIINNTMIVPIAVLAWLFLGEGLRVQEIVGLLLAGLGAVLAQVRRQEDSV